jgi:hypothetical protein
MKPQVKLPTYIFIITFCCIFLWLPIFMNYYVVMQADFLKSGQTYEDINLNILPASQKTQPLVLAKDSLLKQWTENLIKSFDSFYFLTFLEQTTIKLRC